MWLGKEERFGLGNMSNVVSSQKERKFLIFSRNNMAFCFLNKSTNVHKNIIREIFTDDILQNNYIGI
jgi:hypothetical protein